jgi:hypothetical protein
VSATTPVLISVDDTGLPDSKTLWVEPGAATPPTLSALGLSPTTVTGGASSTGTVTLSAAAPAGGTIVSLASSNTAVATVPASVTVPAGQASASFTVTTKTVTASTSVTISGTHNGVTRSAALSVNPAPAVSLGSVSVSPATVTGGQTSSGTVRLSGPAPAGGAVVTLSSSNTNGATVPGSVTVPAGATSINFTVSTKAVTSSSAITISAVYSGVTRTATLTVNPATAVDTVAIQRAEYSSQRLRVEATSTNRTATLKVYVASTGALIGTLTGDGSGRYKGEFSWSTNPQNITVRSSAGGSASASVRTN